MADTSYTFHPADYLRVTVGLSLMEHGAFRLLLDHYYSVDGNIPAEKPRLYKICGAISVEEMRAVDFVSNKYFYEENGTLRNKRADEEIAKKKEFLEMQAMKGKQGGRPKNPKLIKNGAASKDSLESLDQDLKILKDLKDLLKIYESKFFEKFGEKATVNYRKDVVLVKRLLKNYDLQKITELLDKFFDSDDEFILKTGYTIGIFYVSINKLLISGKKRVKSCDFPKCTAPAAGMSGVRHLCQLHLPR